MMRTVRYRYIRSDGQEGTAPDDAALRVAIRSGALDLSSMLFDARDQRWVPARTHAVVRAALDMRRSDERTSPNPVPTPSVTIALDGDGRLSGPTAAPLTVSYGSRASRFWARVFDMLITPLLALLLVGTVVSMLAAEGQNPGTVFWGIIASIVMIPTEAVLLASFGTTPGKLLAGLTVISKDSGGRPPFSLSLRRSWYVWFRGFGLGLPIVVLICNIIAWRRFVRDGEPTWDRDCRTAVVRRSAGSAHAA